MASGWGDLWVGVKTLAPQATFDPGLT